MAMNISAWSIRHPLPSVVFSIILLALGWISFTKLAITRLPSADIPVISVAVSQFGAAPAELEAQVTKTIEDGVSGVEGVRHIASSITDGLSVTTVQFALETNTDRALNDVKDAITRVRSNLPQNVNEPLIQRVDVIGLPIVTYAAISPGKTPEQLSYFVDDVVKRALQGVRNVAQVERIGGVEREILVSLDPDRLQAAGLTAVDVSRRLRGTNVDLAGGRAEIGKNDQAIRTLAGAKTLNELAGTMISLPSGGEVRLEDLGTVTDTIAGRRTFARFNGEPVVALGIKRSKGASDVVVAAAVQKRIDALKESYPDVDLKLIDTSVDFTKGNYESGTPKYSFGGSAVGRFSIFEVGATAKRTGPRYVFDTNLPTFSGPLAGPAVEIFPAKAPAYTLVNLDARMKLTMLKGLEKSYFQLNVYNLFDEFYVGGFSGGLNQAFSGGNYGNPNFVQIGAPRTISGTLSLAF